MGPKLENKLFYKFLKLFFRGVQVTSLGKIYRSNLVFVLEGSTNGNSKINLEI